MNVNLYIPDLGKCTDLFSFERQNNGKLTNNFRAEVQSASFGDSLMYETETGRMFEVVRLGEV